MSFKLLASIATAGLFILSTTPNSLNAQATYTVVHAFNGADGSTPYGTLIGDREGNLYGTTIGGGNTTNAPCENGPYAFGCGVVYKIDRRGNESVLYSFEGGSDGAYPATELLLDEEGNLYGTARGGGILTTNSPCAINSGCGVIFRVDRDGNESVPYSFVGGARGFGPSSGLVRDEDGNFYGATIAGGISNAACTGDGPPGTCGVVFKVNPHGHQTVLHSFSGGTDGYGAYGSLILDWHGDLIGTASNGGDTTSSFCGTTVLNLAGALGCGTVFKIDRTGNFSVVHTFEGKDGGPFPDSWLAADREGDVYGITGNGGSGVNSSNLGDGTIFTIDRNGNESVVYDFVGGAEGFSSLGSVILDREGNLYGATFSGGDTTDPACSAVGGCGVVFRLDPSGHYTVLHTFLGGSDGANPVASLYMDERGDLYGTTTGGGNITDPDCKNGGCGVVFKISFHHSQDGT